VSETRNLRFDLEYDGTEFVGWQVQAEGRTVQGVLQQALRKLFQEEVTPVGSGRTDAGTHAVGQVAHTHTRSVLSESRILLGVNALLPPDVVVSAVRTVDGSFHARYSARGKRYRYRVATTRTALDRRCVWTVRRPLDQQSMKAAALHLTGVLNFRAFCKALPPPDHFECRIDDAVWCCGSHELVFEIEANRFLRHMVRVLVGTLVDVGLGKSTPDGFGRLLSDSADRSQAGQTAPSRGLCMLWVNYDESFGGRSGERQG
jgi:tRNA pseudouridine38-40 synthase